MTTLPAGFPPDWLEAQGREPATDLDLAVLLINTFDLLDDPPDRLTNLDWWCSALGQIGHSELASQLRVADLKPLRRLRDTLRAAFEASDVAAAAAILNPQLSRAAAVFELVVDAGSDGGDRARFEVGRGRQGYDALAARLPAALAQHVAEHGVRRLGTCHSDPCRCAFIDRTRAGTRKYCCSYCNDRHAARAYRARKRT